MVKQVPYVLVGLGSVGRGLARAIVEAAELHSSTYGIEFACLALCDSGGAVGVHGAPLSAAEVAKAVSAKESGAGFAGLPRYVARGERTEEDFLVSVVEAASGAEGCIVGDCTATDSTVPALLDAVRKGLKVASANKKPYTVSQAVYDELTTDKSGFKRLNQIRHESTVGAGLPVIAGLTRTVEANDPISKINGTFSGTLGYVMTGLQSGEPFSAVVNEAKRLGYTEPDPRDDLGGVDVARKALILARGMGWKLELSDVAVEPLYPEALAALSVPDFMDALPSLDAEFAARIEAAKTDGQVLRFAAAIDASTRKLTVGPANVSADTPLGRLSGTDNLVEIYTQWYEERPLVIQGAGAGVGATAAGVLADMIELAFASPSR